MMCFFCASFFIPEDGKVKAEHIKSSKCRGEQGNEKYEFIAILKADNKQKNFVTDGVDIDIEGNKYHLYTYLNPDSMKAQDFNQNWKYKITLK